jgi:hypothetical protein
MGGPEYAMPLASVAVRTTLAFAAVVGVPLSWPVAEIERPWGSPVAEKL